MSAEMDIMGIMAQAVLGLEMNCFLSIVRVTLEQRNFPNNKRSTL
jgi:hypothetical protein